MFRRRSRNQVAEPKGLSRRELLELLGLTAAGGLVGCSGLSNLLGLQEPTADYRDFRVQSLSLQQVGFDLGFDLGNPNEVALPVASLDWNLDLFQRPFTFGQIRFEENHEQLRDDINPEGGVLTYLGVQHIPAQGQLALNTPFAVAILDTFEGIARIALGEDVPFGIGGKLLVTSRFGNFDLPFSAQGVWPNRTLIRFLDSIADDILRDLIFGYQSGQSG
jgi:hypothetical protein